MVLGHVAAVAFGTREGSTDGFGNLLALFMILLGAAGDPMKPRELGQGIVLLIHLDWPINLCHQQLIHSAEFLAKVLNIALVAFQAVIAHIVWIDGVQLNLLIDHSRVPLLLDLAAVRCRVRIHPIIQIDIKHVHSTSLGHSLSQTDLIVWLSLFGLEIFVS